MKVKGKKTVLRNKKWLIRNRKGSVTPISSPLLLVSRVKGGIEARLVVTCKEGGGRRWWEKQWKEKSQDDKEGNRSNNRHTKEIE